MWREAGLSNFQGLGLGFSTGGFRGRPGGATPPAPFLLDFFLVNVFRMVLRHFERDGLWSRLNGFGRWWHHKFVVQNGIQAFAKLSVQNALHCISENFNLKNFPGEACFRNSLENCAVRSPGGRYRAHIATLYHISRPLYHNILRPPEIQYQWTC